MIGGSGTRGAAKLLASFSSVRGTFRLSIDLERRHASGKV
jgi:hypothetical protein